MDNPNPKITFYTNHGCPFCHRVHITLKELGLPYLEVIIDLDKPREDWYLKMNPRGTVPAIRYSSVSIEDEVVVTESAIITQFLCDTKPSHVLPESSVKPLSRARYTFFVDTWMSRVGSFWVAIQLLDDESKKAEVVKESIAKIRKEVEPMLQNDNGPFYGGSKEMTFVEVLLAPFLMRLNALMNENGILPDSLKEGLDGLPNFKRWMEAITKEKSVIFIWDWAEVLRRGRKDVARIKETRTKAAL